MYSDYKYKIFIKHTIFVSTCCKLSQNPLARKLRNGLDPLPFLIWEWYPFSWLVLALHLFLFLLVDLCHTVFTVHLCFWYTNCYLLGYFSVLLLASFSLLNCWYTSTLYWHILLSTAMPFIITRARTDSHMLYSLTSLHECMWWITTWRLDFMHTITAGFIY